MKKRFALSATVLLVILAFGASVFGVNYVVAQTDQAGSKLQAANSAFAQAFNAALDAERAGANVTVLLGRLNVAADLLAQAEMSYSNGDADNTADKADSALSIALEVKSDAVSVENAALVAYQNGFWLTVGFSVIGVAVFVFVLFLVWRLVKQSYVKNFLGAKPEVASQ
jgi:methionine-rich copper-binding protein CopC